MNLHVTDFVYLVIINYSRLNKCSDMSMEVEVKLPRPFRKL